MRLCHGKSSSLHFDAAFCSALTEIECWFLWQLYLRLLDVLKEDCLLALMFMSRLGGSELS